MKKSYGFTLVEIAIVLVIIGLLLGGVLKGQELVNGAKVKNLIGDFRTIPTFVYAYQDKFRRLPGDDLAASVHVGAPDTANGDGDGQIEGNWNDGPADGACASETCRFWLHVRLANIATGTTTMDSNYLPLNAEGGPLGVTSIPPVADWSGSLFVCSGGIAGRLARQIDTTIDDGATASGMVRVIAGSPATAATLTPNNDATLYTVCSSF